MKLSDAFSSFADGAAKATGRPYAFVICVAAVVAWAVSGPIFKFSDTWQLVINTSTTIVTFLMVFLIQNTQNRETSAMQAKLDEIIISLEGADNRFIGIEHLSDKELDEIVEDCERRASKASRKESASGRAMSESKDRATAKREKRPSPISNPGRRATSPAKGRKRA